MSSDFPINEYLPDWLTVRFAVLDPTRRWANAVHREVIDRLAETRSRSNYELEFETCTTARDTLLVCELTNTVAAIIFADGMEKECLSVLGGLSRRHRRLLTLIIATERHHELLPVLYEAGADTVLFDVRDDNPIAAWCVRCLERAD